MARTKHVAAKKQKRKPSAQGTSKRPHRYKPGTRALQEIRRLQKTSQRLIPFAPFVREVRALSSNLSRDVYRWQAEALIALQEAAEDFLVHLFGDAMLCAIHAKRVTLRLF
ncbi:histone H3 [Corchorus olitorius]|uniref:Histone H3 n=1 Tax=Corchorus olitorius TaxID=93759 RepID=A0A1R3KNE7_9ROSI|nr:histone H3 [Corchorus olitorius]